MACLINEDTTEYIPVMIGATGIVLSMYNYLTHPEIAQSERDVQLLTNFGTTALIGFMSTTVLKFIRISTCKVDI